MLPPVPTNDLANRLEALRESEARARTAADFSPVGIFMAAPDGMIVYDNVAIRRVLGLGPDEPLGDRWAAAVHPGDQARVFALWSQFVAGIRPDYDAEFRFVRPDGTERLVHARATRVQDGERLLGFAGTAEDITERRQVERRIQHLNRVYVVLSDINQTIVREKNLPTLLTAACRIAVEKGGFRMVWVGRRNAETQSIETMASAGMTDGYLETLNLDLRSDLGSQGPERIALATGTHAVCNDIERESSGLSWRVESLRRGYRSVAAFPIKVDGQSVGTFTFYSGDPGVFDSEELQLLDELAMDISFALEINERAMERERSDEELRSRTAFFEAQVESARDGMLVVNSEGKKLLQNRRMTELWKIPPHIADDPDDAVQVQFVRAQVKDPETFMTRIAYLVSHNDLASQDEIELVDGTLLDRYSAPVQDDHGKYYGRIWTFRDITESRKLEEQLRQSQKMEAIGQLAGGVAHDFNNILAMIMMQAEITETTTGLPLEAREGLHEIKAAAERAASLTRQLLLFGRRQVMQPRQLNLNEIVTSLTKMLQRLVGADVVLQLNLHSRPLVIRADAGMMDQVLLNLVINARDAMPDGGRLFIETTETVFTPAEAHLIPEAKPGRHVCLRVIDTGSGIPLENKSRIFEPFFTTKEPGKGTGLGLATVFAIVKQHGGSLLVDSDVGRGTTFQVFLPLAEGLGPVSTQEAEKPRPRGGTETLLVVEDEPSVRMLTRVVLERQGYQVLEAADGVEALQVWERHGAPIHLLLTDIVMPGGISGRELAVMLRERNPRLRVVFTSGYSAEIAGRELALQSGQDFIQKPSSPQEILEAVRRCLDS